MTSILEGRFKQAMRSSGFAAAMDASFFAAIKWAVRFNRKAVSVAAPRLTRRLPRMNGARRSKALRFKPA